MTRLQDYIKSPLAVVCHDAGAANLIVEWLKDYSGELRVCMEGPARVIWRKHFPDKKLIPINRVIKDSTTLLSGTGWADLEHSARIDAKIRGIKSIAVIDHWAKYRERFIRDGREVLPDVIIVTDKYAFRMAKDLFSSILVIELPNNYLQEEAKLAISERLRQCRTPIENILILGEPLRHQMKGKDVYLEFVAIDYLLTNLDKINIANRSVNILLRLHPSEPKFKYDRILKKYKDSVFKFELTKNTHLYQDIAWADLVAGMNSFALVVALSADVPTISILPPQTFECILPYKEIMHLKDK